MKAFITIAILSITSVFVSSIYAKKFTTLNGTEVAMNQYQGKKILLVNIASGSEYFAIQLPQLQQLYQMYKDSLVVIAFPSNDFGREQRNNDELQQLLKNTYHISFPVSVLTSVKDAAPNTHAVYKWLQNKNENGEIKGKIKKDFQKFLLDKTGNIMGIFSAETQPLDKVVTDAITQ